MNYEVLLRLRKQRAEGVMTWDWKTAGSSKHPRAGGGVGEWRRQRPGCIHTSAVAMPPGQRRNCPGERAPVHAQPMEKGWWWQTHGKTSPSEALIAKNRVLCLTPGSSQCEAALSRDAAKSRKRRSQCKAFPFWQCLLIDKIEQGARWQGSSGNVIYTGSQPQHYKEKYKSITSSAEGRVSWEGGDDDGDDVDDDKDSKDSGGDDNNYNRNTSTAAKPAFMARHCPRHFMDLLRSKKEEERNQRETEWRRSSPSCSETEDFIAEKLLSLSSLTPLPLHTQTEEKHTHTKNKYWLTAGGWPWCWELFIALPYSIFTKIVCWKEKQDKRR